ncbi:MAG: hypothetical protein RMX96_31775 [Nostoc sp. ChiSLP02]|nr:hypothetical protein [Nostoc sp. DedSLP05]MDZ8103364.1 hypothetical protein [Nostoc sp. DedSLP01]MDZ8189403.1 hypothetical protein [Nostoc sp. ChiSLP02]
MTQDVRPLRVWRQGKQLSQIIAYIWRWADEESKAEKMKNAQKLKTYFMVDETKLSVEELLKRLGNKTHNKCDTNLKKLFRADPRKWLNDGKPNSDEAAELLVAVFGEKRIKNPDKYLSPMFNSVELGDEKDIISPYYEFHIDPSSFIGELRDPDLETPFAFRYYVSFPPRPELGEATVTKKQLEDWIKDDKNEDVYPSVPFIPVTTT